MKIVITIGIYKTSYPILNLVDSEICFIGIKRDSEKTQVFKEQKNRTSDFISDLEKVIICFC